MRNDWTNDIGKRMDEHRIDGFGDMWPGIEAAVKEAQAAQKRQKARAAWLRRSVAAVAAAAAVVAAVLWLPAIRSSRTAAPSGTTVTSPNIAQNDNANSSQASQTAGPAPTAEVPPTHAAGTVRLASAAAEPSLLAQNATSHGTAPKQAIATIGGAGTKNQSEDAMKNADEVIAGTAKENDRPEATAENGKQQAKPQSKGAATTWAYDVSNAPIEIARADNDDKWAIGLFAFNSPAKIGNSNDDNLYAFADGSTMGGTNSIAPSIGVADVNLQHKQPVSVGASVQYSLNRQWSLETGLAYTYLNSDYSDKQINCEQRLHYLGIPVKVNFSLYNSRRLNVYLTAGGMAEKLVSGHFKVAYTQAKGYDTNNTLKEGGLQWSVKGAAGIAFNITPAVAIYAEPGIGHYFDNGSRMKSFYKDSPTCFNLLVGLRFNAKR